MLSLTMEAHFGRTVQIDMCRTCQTFWFDGQESLQLAPAAVLSLFKLIGENHTRPVAAPALAACPRCGLHLMPVHDQQRQTKFEYRRCPRGHGRLTTFFNFLREKDFVRPLSEAQIAQLKRHVQTINCSNCGAPIDLATSSACSHCGSPLSFLDVGQAEALLKTLGEAGHPHSTATDPALPLALARARTETMAAFQAFDGESRWFNDASSTGLVGAALGSIAKWLAG